MIRIKVNWDFISPVLQVISGTLKVEEIKFSTTPPKNPENNLLLECRVKVEKHSTGFSSINKGIPYQLFEELRPQIDIMIKSFYYGILLENKCYSWVEDSANKDFEGWAEEKGIKFERKKS